MSSINYYGRISRAFRHHRRMAALRKEGTNPDIARIMDNELSQIRKGLVNHA